MTMILKLTKNNNKVYLNKNNQNNFKKININNLKMPMKKELHYNLLSNNRKKRNFYHIKKNNNLYRYKGYSNNKLILIILNQSFEFYQHGVQFIKLD